MPKITESHSTHNTKSSEETIDNLRLRKEELEQKVLELQKDIYKLQLERDILESAGKILKKDQ